MSTTAIDGVTGTFSHYPVLTVGYLIVFFQYFIIFTNFEIFNRDYDDNINIPVLNFSSNFTHYQRQLIYNANN